MTSGGIRIPFNRPAMMGRELEYIAEAVRGGHSAGDGPYGRRCQEWLERRLGVGKALLTTSCTHALEIAALLLDLRPGDEVIVPAFTFVSTANAFAVHGARIVFADVSPETFNLDPNLLPALISDRTRAVVPVHYGGVACPMEAIRDRVGSRGIRIVEDNAHGLFGAYRGRPLGSIGDLATLSFHETKNIICGEGGALLINDASLVPRAEILREKGTDRSRFFRGEVDKYTWQDLGSSYVMSDILAAFLLAQFEASDGIQAARARRCAGYREALADWAAGSGVRLPIVPDDCEPAHHLFYLLMPDEATRDALMAHLKARGILAVFHYQPLHDAPAGRRLGIAPGGCPVADDVSRRILRLPLYAAMRDDEFQEVVEAVRAFRA